MRRFALFPALLPALAALLAAQENPPAAASAPAAEPAEQILMPPEPGRFKILFQRFRTEHAALSPDGGHVAYSLREGEETSVIIFATAHPDKARARVVVITDTHATPMLSDEQREKTPGRIRWMRWVTPMRLVVETNRAYVGTLRGDWTSLNGEVVAFDADGGNFQRLATPEEVSEFIPFDNPSNLFSTRRTGNTTFRGSQVWTPNQPVPASNLGAPPSWAPDPPPETNDPLQPAASPPEGDLTASADIRARSLRVFDLDFTRPGAVTLVSTGAKRVSGGQSIGFHSLDAATGKLTTLGDNLVPEKRSPLLDRLGRPRLLLPNSVTASFPFAYTYLGEEGRGRPRPLDETAGLAGFRVSPENYFGERSIPLGFDEADPNVLYYAANVGRDTYGIYSFNLATKQKGSFALENPRFDLVEAPPVAFADGNVLVFDRFSRQLAGVRYQTALRTTAWLGEGPRAVQAELEQALPGRSVDLVEWDEAGRRFLVSTEGPAEPGAFYLYDRENRQLSEFVRRAPWIDAGYVHTTLPFGFTLADGSRLSGLVTVPAQPRIKPIPMVVVCPDQPWQRVSPDFRTEVSALAAMGFVVVQLNGRGAWGLGLKQRQSLTNGYDLVQVEDIATTVATLEQLFHVNPRRVAIMGRGHGGFIALRALQAHPDKFRCAIALESPVDLADWLRNQRWTDEDIFPHLTRAWLGDEARLKAAPLVRQPEALTKPVLLLSYPGVPGESRRPPYLAARRFAEDVRRHGTTVEFADLHLDYVRGLPAARAEVFDRIEGFLNEHVYDYKVKLRELEILPDKNNKS